jgi:hypothetical protein
MSYFTFAEKTVRVEHQFRRSEACVRSTVKMNDNQPDNANSPARPKGHSAVLIVLNGRYESRASATHKGRGQLHEAGQASAATTYGRNIYASSSPGVER